MHEKGISSCLIKVFVRWFDNLCEQIYWNNDFSSIFTIGSEVPQGSLLGGKFFNLIMDTILQELQKLRLGCRIGGTFATAIAYADDIVLLSPSLIGMQHMFVLCANLFASAGLKFNIDKFVTAVCTW